ncbi:uncharacterized protein STEHIDRAFT_182917 [Stereum hirsutum FP-91666 SS1]|uniref:uncharacterized protein n=1 Tax=Stereum hirsutum (strain FP-91666) TaxID=721885 RepID=UPI00044497F1|nr:uncharacterized protein STEHIDRAFT_182917 [Stereum hirsutum FP-91666 SS1]EIM80926.1 hypothetical protein STEHIDRAFT_182917 [Stereum hirsutum FP-91666 SS1]
MLSVLVVLASSVTFVPVALAQSSAWGQCGGVGWSGATTCVSGYTCTYSNDYYSQCILGAASSSSAPASSSTQPTSTTSTGATSTASSPVGPEATATAYSGVNYWFSFGDSYTQTGFDSTLTLPSPDNAFGNPVYPGYTATGGPNWIDEAAAVSNNSLVLTYNYAYGGATIDASLVTPYEPTVLSMTDQVNEFLAQPNIGTGSKVWTSDNSLFSFWIGINDIGNSYYESGDRDAFSDVLLDAYFALVQKTVSPCTDAGARNFLFLNVPPVDRSPLMVPQGTAATSLEKSMITYYNAQLAVRATNFSSTHTGAQTWVWDANAAFSAILDDPTAYGFVDNTSYGGTDDFWGNNLHPASAAQVMFGDDVAQLLNGTVW